jgi:LacI family transcriptional regulator
MEPARVTMRDVARMAGVSVATVSSVINGTAVVSPKSTTRVREAMRALDYRPDQVARSLKVGKTFVIGVVVPDITNVFYPEVVRGVEDAADAEGYSVILCNSNEDVQRETRHLDMLRSRRVDGVLLACSDAASEYERLTRWQLPLVYLDRIPEAGGHSTIATDNLEAGHLATRHLIELGHRRIAVIVGNLRLSPHRDRLEGYRQAMADSGLSVREEYIRVGTQRIETGQEASRELLERPEPPTAILSTNNRMLLGVMRAIADLCLNCPARVSVIGFDDYAWTEHHTPKLTVVAQDSFGIGRRAMELLLRRMRGGESESLRIKAHLKVRESTAPPPMAAQSRTQ